MRQPRLVLVALLSVATLFANLLTPAVAHAADTGANAGFSLQVSPSPLIATVKPGQTTQLELHIRNTSSQAQDLKMGLRDFSVDSSTGAVQLKNGEPAEIKDFVSFSHPQFTVQPGEFFTQKVIITVPSSAGFTYTFAVTISQQHPPKAAAGKTAISGSVAVFTLLSVDRPGATRKLELQQLTVTKHAYEYLPATISVKLKNTGNTLIAPKGTIYIQRGTDDKVPIAAIDLNKTSGYILPGSSRTLSVAWNDGAPHYVSKTENGQVVSKLDWGGSDLSKFRIGRYVAKVVAVYDDGGHDVPLNAQVTFWVIPWRMLGIALLFLIVSIVGAFTILRKSTKAIKKPVAHARHKE